MSIRGKLYLSSIAVVLPLVVVAIVTVNLARGALRDGVRDGLASIADIERDRIVRQLETNENRLDDVRDADSDLGEATADLIDAWRRFEGADGDERDPSVDTEEPLSAVRAELEALVDRENELTGVLLYAVAANGDAVRVAPDEDVDDFGIEMETERSLRTVYTDARDHGVAVGDAFERDGERFYLQAVRLAGDDGDPALTVAGRESGVTTNTDPRAVLIAQWRLDSVLPAIDATQVGETAEVYLVQRTSTNDAELISDRPGRADAFAGETAASFADSDALEIRALSGRAETSDGLVDDTGRDVIAALRSIDGSHWALVVKVDEDEAFAGVSRAVQVLVLSFVVAVTLVIVSSTLLGRSVIKRLQRVTDLARAISDGDLAQRAGDDSSDELGVLAQAFDKMATRIESDLDSQKKLGALLEHQALHDDLTGLPNRLALTRELSRTMETSSELTVLFCDLDEFKAVNDELGHSAGDELLRQVASRFAEVLADGDELGRFGGDEFVVLRRGAVHPAEAEDLAERLCRSLDRSIPVAGRDVFITASIGIAASAEGEGATPESLLRDADTAMYRAKELGKARHVTLDASTRARAATRLSAAMDLRRAIEDDDLVLFYQPIVDLSTGEILSAEALVRWPRLSGKWVMPGEFISLAEASGLARSLDRWVIDRACRQLRAWMDAAEASSTSLSLSMSVNVSTVGLGDGTLGGDVTEALEAWSIPPERLCVEITEGALIGDPADTALTIGELKKIGVRLAIDDFGTGHSSLDRLRRLPIDVLKMDMTFVRDIDDDPGARAIAGAVANLGNTLGVDVVAEGVERVTQYHTLWNLGCRSGQGYWFGRPMSADDLLELVRQSDSARWLHTVQPPSPATPALPPAGDTSRADAAPSLAPLAPLSSPVPSPAAPSPSSAASPSPGPIRWTGTPVTVADGPAPAAAAPRRAAVPSPATVASGERPSPDTAGGPAPAPRTGAAATSSARPDPPQRPEREAAAAGGRHDGDPPLFVAKAVVDGDAKHPARRRNHGVHAASMLGWDHDDAAARRPHPGANGRAGRLEIARALVGAAPSAPDPGPSEAPGADADAETDTERMDGVGWEDGEVPSPAADPMVSSRG
ncbi:MAG: EAL domain-containing protein [Actinomycetota bacterium]|nr:EAL domain-containing protein [Actinomycetota bacterium]